MGLLYLGVFTACGGCILAALRPPFLIAVQSLW